MIKTTKITALCAVFFALAFGVLIGGSSPALAACTQPPGEEGVIVYNATYKAMQFCNGTDWIAMGSITPGSGGGSSTESVSAALTEFFLSGQSLDFSEVSAGRYHSCAVTTTNKGYCWGRNSKGEVGDNSTTQRNEPVIIKNGENGGGSWKSISAGHEHTCGIAGNDRAYCWGYEFSGRLGNGVSGVINQLTPISVLNGASATGTWKIISAGHEHTCGIDMADKAYCWGQNSFNPLGTGGVSGNQAAPYQVENGANTAGTWKYISAGNEHSCGIGTDNKGYCWGSNASGRLGDGTTAAKTTPVLVLNGSNTLGTWKTIVAGSARSCGISTDDKAYCWGENGINANGGAGTVSVPGAVLNGDNTLGTWKSIHNSSSNTSSHHGCGISTDDKAYCWGYDSNGQLGNAATTGNPAAPDFVEDGINVGGGWTFVTTGEQHTCGISTTSKLYCWGNNGNGRSGLGISSGNTFAPDNVSLAAAQIQCAP